MKVNPIKMARNVGMATLAAGMLSACTSTYIPDKTKEYFADKPALEYQEFVNDCKNRTLNSMQAQAKLDSLAYREIFNATEAAKDSEIIKEYNEIANTGLNTLSHKELKQNLANTGITLNEYNKIWKSGTHRGGYMNSQQFTFAEEIQHKTDSISYRQFFEKHNLLNSENLAKFNEITEKIRPY